MRPASAGKARPKPLSAGLVLAERFQLVERLGMGGFGEVWRARHVNLGVDVALKLLNSNAAGNAEVAMIEERFRFEAQISAQLSKKTRHVIAVHDAGVCEVGPFLAMEVVAGRSLEEMIDQAPLSPVALSQLLFPLGEALDAAHAAGIVHRDLKPGNVLVDGPCSVKLIDFGIAKAVGSNLEVERPKETDAGFFVGTPEYMSPEQLRIGAPVSPATDLWALGVLAYEAITGMMPFGGASAAEIMVRIADRGFTAPSRVRGDLPAALDAWFTRALAKEPGERFGSGRAAAEAFAEAIQRRTTTRRRPSRLSEAPPISILPPAPRASAVGWIAASALVGLMFVITLFAVNRASPAGHVGASAFSRVGPAFTAAVARVAASAKPETVAEAPRPEPPPAAAPREMAAPPPAPEPRAADVEAKPAPAPVERPVAGPRSRDKSSVF